MICEYSQIADECESVVAVSHFRFGELTIKLCLKIYVCMCGYEGYCERIGVCGEGVRV